MNRVILGEASIVSSSGFGKEERKGKKKKKTQYNLLRDYYVPDSVNSLCELYCFISTGTL